MDRLPALLSLFAEKAPLLLTLNLHRGGHRSCPSLRSAMVLRSGHVYRAIFNAPTMVLRIPARESLVFEEGYNFKHPRIQGCQSSIYSWARQICHSAQWLGRQDQWRPCPPSACLLMSLPWHMLCAARHTGQLGQLHQTGAETVHALAKPFIGQEAAGIKLACSCDRTLCWDLGSTGLLIWVYIRLSLRLSN